MFDCLLFILFHPIMCPALAGGWPSIGLFPTSRFLLAIQDEGRGQDGPGGIWGGGWWWAIT